MDKLLYKRVLLKISGEALRGDAKDEVIAHEALMTTANQLKAVSEFGVQMGVVVGGGNIWRARTAQGMERNRADNMGMLATAINALALSDALMRLGVKATVLSSVEMNRFCDVFSARAANSALDNGNVVIFACGSGSPFFTTDTAASLRACEINADALLLAKNVDALYDKNPDINPDAVRLPHPSYDEVIARSLGGMDITAVTMCKEQHIPIVIFPLASGNSIVNAVHGKNVGTLIDS